MGHPLVTYVGPTVCSLLMFFPVFGTAYQRFGSFGITWYRAICVRGSYNTLTVKRYDSLATTGLLTIRDLFFSITGLIVTFAAKNLISDL